MKHHFFPFLRTMIFVTIIVTEASFFHPASVSAVDWGCLYDRDGEPQCASIENGDRLSEADRSTACQRHCTLAEPKCERAPQVVPGCPPQEFTSPYTRLEPPIAEKNLGVLIGNVIKSVLGVIGAITFLVFLVGGALWLTSAGNEDRVKKGTDTMVWAVVGLAVIFSSYAILNTILSVARPG